jgi:hypothetical protein
MRKACASILKDSPEGTIAVCLCIGPAPFAGFQASTCGLPRPETSQLVAQKFRELADEIDRSGLGSGFEQGQWGDS